MPAQSLFVYAITYTPPLTKSQIEKNETAETVIVKDATTVTAATQEKARDKAVLSIPKEYHDKMDGVAILIRPF